MTDPFIFDQADIGSDSVVQAHLDAGRSAIHFDEALGHYVQENPDGSRCRVELRRGQPTLILEKL